MYLLGLASLLGRSEYGNGVRGTYPEHVKHRIKAWFVLAQITTPWSGKGSNPKRDEALRITRGEDYPWPGLWRGLKEQPAADLAYSSCLLY